MVRRGKLKSVATLAALLAVSLNTVGCQVVMPGGNGENAPNNPAPPWATGPDGNKAGAKPFTPAGTGLQPVSFQVNDNGHPMMPPGTPPGGPMVPQGPMGHMGAMAPMGHDPGPIPTEINKVSLPPYTVAPPDILFIDAARLVPKPPYRVEPLEVLFIKVSETLPKQPIEGPFVVSPEGTINLGYGYGTVRVGGLTVDQIQAVIRSHLSNVLNNPQVVVSLAQFRGLQQTRGEHLVRPDGTISLGSYGSIYVAGMTLGQVKCAIEKHLSQYVINPQVAVDVYAYNSQWYYVVFNGGGFGEQVYRLPITGNETVLDAISNLQGMPPQASLRRVWVARPAPCGHPCDQILMVDWEAVVKGGSTCTNYQIFPNDRVYVDADCFIKADLWLAKVLAPAERILGFTLLGASTYWTIRNGNNINNGNGVIVTR
jgi:polysaccharide export outer membrane protein